MSVYENLEVEANGRHIYCTLKIVLLAAFAVCNFNDTVKQRVEQFCLSQSIGIIIDQ